MAYSFQDALDLVQQFAHGIPVNQTLTSGNTVGQVACDVVNQMMWRFYPWSWSIATFTPITTVDGVQDYNVTNNDVLRPLRVQLVRTDITPNESRELSLLANLSVEFTRKGGLETNTNAGYYASGPFIRLMYAASVGTGQVLQIQGQYQKISPTLTTLATTVPFTDRYFNVFVEGLKWKIYQLGDDPRAGTMQYSKNGSMQRGYTGQLGLFMDTLLEMARTEDLQAGDEFSFPENPLGVGRNYWPGLYGV